MAKSSKRETVFDVSPADLLAVLTTAEFQEEQRKLDEAVVDVKFVEKTRTDDKLVFELRSTEYERGMTGLNKKKTIQSVSAINWDLKAMKGSWTYTSPSIDRVKLDGTHEIVASGDKARLVAVTNVEVKIPLVGKKAEGMIIDGMEKGRQRYDDLVRRYLKK